MKAGLEYCHGAQDFLDQLHHPRAHRRFYSTPVVGHRRNGAGSLRQLVDRLPQRLVLKHSISTTPLAPPVSSSIADAPRATDLDTSERNLR